MSDLIFFSKLDFSANLGQIIHLIIFIDKTNATQYYSPVIGVAFLVQG